MKLKPDELSGWVALFYTGVCVGVGLMGGGWYLSLSAAAGWCIGVGLAKWQISRWP